MLGNLVGDLPRASFLAIHKDWGVARDRKEDQCAFLAFLMALKYPDFESLAASWSPRRPDLRALRAAPWNSLRSVVSRGDHQDFERADGLLWGVWSRRMDVTESRLLSNQVSNEALVGRGGGGESVSPL